MSNLSLNILDQLRVTAGVKLTISELLDPRFDGRITNSTGVSIFGMCIYNLCELGLVSIYDNYDSDITSSFCELFKESSGYEIANFFTGNETKTFVKLTDKLDKFQKVTGLSISKQLAEREGSDAIYVKPIFGKPTGKIRADVFVVMPFREDIDPVYQDHIKDVCDDLGLECKRADDIFSSSAIMYDIWELINNSDLIIADCTGKNPNVFYEIGIAHSLGKKVVLITQNSEDVPSDIRHMRYIRYDLDRGGMKDFERTLKKTISESFSFTPRNFNRLATLEQIRDLRELNNKRNA